MLAQNTYITECRQPFVPSKITAVMKDAVDKYLAVPPSVETISAELAAVVKDALVASGIAPRHKLVVQCVAGENLDQAVTVASKCLWRKEDDNYANYSWCNEFIFVCVICFGFYFE